MDETGHIKKDAVLKALEKTLGVVTTAVKSVGVARSTYYNWLNDDKDIESVALDFAESQLHKQIGDGNTSATIFYLKTKGKKRGYVERQELEHSGGDKPVNIKLVIDEDTDFHE